MVKPIESIEHQLSRLMTDSRSPSPTFTESVAGEPEAPSPFASRIPSVRDWEAYRKQNNARIAREEEEAFKMYLDKLSIKVSQAIKIATTPANIRCTLQFVPELLKYALKEAGSASPYRFCPCSDTEELSYPLLVFKHFTHMLSEGGWESSWKIDDVFDRCLILKPSQNMHESNT